MLRANLLAVGVLVLSFVSCTPGSEKRTPPVETSRQVSGRPTWLKEGIVMVGSWEPTTFILRRGGQETNALEVWNAERSERSVRRLKELGVNLVIVNLHKAFGLEAESSDIDATRAFVELAHRHGIRVGGYIGSTLGYETFFKEEPGAKDWMQIDEFGRPIYYNLEQTFRYAACRNNPGYRSFIKKLLGLGVEDIGLDLIHFDQMQWWAEPLSCRCTYCRGQFREFLKSRYSDPKRARIRFGFSDVSDLGPPPYNLVTGSIRFAELRNPLMQEWALFRAASLARRYGEYDQFIRQMNPEVALEGNPNLNLGFNQGFMNGADYGQLLQHGDVVWSEEPNHAAWTSDGRVISKVRSFKIARSMGQSLFVYTGSRYGNLTAESPPELRMAEALAYNGANLGMVGDLMPEGADLTSAAQSYIRFLHAHLGELADTRSLADVAVLRSFASIEFNPGRSLVSTTLFEQTLLQNRIPFDIILDAHLDRLDRYKVLVLGNQDALSETQLSLIQRFVNEGGGLVATENSSMLTEWRLRRPAFGLADLFGEDTPGSGPVRRRVGQGRAVYLPRIEWAVDPPEPEMHYRFTNQYWQLPLNQAELVAAVRWAAADRLRVTVDAPPSVTAELVENRGSDAWILHLVNFNFSRTVTNLGVQLRLPEGRRLREVTVETPDGPAPQLLPFTQTDGVTALRVPFLKVYDLVKLRLARP